MKELITIQTELKAPKSQFNKFGGYRYRKAEDILEAVKPLLKACKCTLTLTDDIVMVGNRIYVKATAVIRNEKGETESTIGWAREEESKKGMDGSQVTGASSSYARKYALNGLFAIDDNQDSDTTNTGSQTTAPQMPQPQQPRPQMVAPGCVPTDITALLAQARASLAQCRTKADLQLVAKTYSSLMNNKQFVSECTAKRKQLGI